ncbi:hypothetical protein [Mesoterricola silvestris]|uniref:Uncharacterized protein n=1 Tax=Mesoterricola silvestris TaxID=2927979 RepID=A0AA48K8R0_9BACT|nr:hypothetical protein [Mesoterricola silvestris]BDU73189.1 hypothetical protein METEAL_23630 [Mesoterricola silvestris]
MSNYLFGLCLLTAVGQSSALLAARAKDAPQTIPAATGNASSTESPRPRVFRLEERGPDGSITVFESLGSPPGMAFRTGYFGMPVVMGPYESFGNRLNIIAHGGLYSFIQKDMGFSLESIKKMPPQPPERLLEFAERANYTEIWTKDALFQAYFFLGSILGYQLDESGNIYWVGSTGLYKHLENGWKLVYSFPEKFSSRRSTNYSRTGVILLPGKRIALFGGEDFFIQIVEMGDEAVDSKIIKSIDYDFLGCTAANYPAQAGPQFCFASGDLIFHLRKTGHIFRMNLTSYNLKDLDVPWMVQEFTKPNIPLKWKNTNGSSNISAPIIPESIAFASEFDGTVHAAALMFNNSLNSMNCFTISSETSNIKSKIQMGDELPDPILYQNTKGDFVPISGAKPEPMTKLNAEPR